MSAKTAIAALLAAWVSVSGPSAIAAGGIGGWVKKRWNGSRAQTMWRGVKTDWKNAIDLARTFGLADTLRAPRDTGLSVRQLRNMLRSVPEPIRMQMYFYARGVNSKSATSPAAARKLATLRQVFTRPRVDTRQSLAGLFSEPVRGSSRQIVIRSANSDNHAVRISFNGRGIIDKRIETNAKKIDFSEAFRKVEQAVVGGFRSLSNSERRNLRRDIGRYFRSMANEHQRTGIVPQRFKNLQEMLGASSTSVTIKGDLVTVQGSHLPGKPPQVKRTVAFSLGTTGR